MSKLFPSLVNDINTFNMKLKMFVSQLKNEDLWQITHFKKKSKCGVHHGSMAKYTEKISNCKSHLKVLFMILVKKKTAGSLL